MKKYKCSIYKDRPMVCKIYPFEDRAGPNNNIYCFRFKECQFHDGNWEFLLPEELDKTEEDIMEFCIRCGICCFVVNWDKLGMTEEGKKCISKIFIDKEWHMENSIKCEFLIVEDE